MKKIKRKAIQLEPIVMIAFLDNGWLVQTPSESEDFPVREAVTRDDSIADDGLSDCRALQQLLWVVREGIGDFYSKHNAYNVEIVIRDMKTGKEVEET